MFVALRNLHQARAFENDLYSQHGKEAIAVKGPFLCCEPHYNYESKAKCEAFLMKISFYFCLHMIENQFP